MSKRSEQKLRRKPVAIEKADRVVTPTAADPVAEKETTISWLFTTLGGFAAVTALPALYKSRSVESKLSFPGIGEISTIRDLVFGVPVLSALAITTSLLCLWFQSGKAPRTSFCEMFPRAFNQPLNGTMAFMRFGCFILFVVWPTYVAGALVVDLANGGRIIQRKTHQVLRSQFEFPEGWSIFDNWHWQLGTDRGTDTVSVLPGLEPYTWGALVCCSVLLFLSVIARALFFSSKR